HFLAPRPPPPPSPPPFPYTTLFRSAAAIHGNKSQNARERTLAQFKSHQPPVLVATDIAARGLDIDDISHVVNFDLPMTAELYVQDRKSTRLNSSHVAISYAVFCLKK